MQVQVQVQVQAHIKEEDLAGSLRRAIDAVTSSRDVLLTVLSAEDVHVYSQALAQVAIEHYERHALAATPLPSCHAAARAREQQIARTMLNLTECRSCHNAVSPLFVVFSCMVSCPQFEAWCKDRSPAKFGSFMDFLRETMRKVASPDGVAGNTMEQCIVERLCVAYRIAPVRTT